jgi:hypothetical protein
MVKLGVGQEVGVSVGEEEEAWHLARVQQVDASIAQGYQQCCGSESEIIRIFWLDLNPKKKFGFGFGFGCRHCCEIKIKL